MLGANPWDANNGQRTPELFSHSAGLSMPLLKDVTGARAPASPGTSPNRDVPTWTSAPDVPTQTMLSTAWTDTIKYRVCANMCLEAETQLGKSVAPQVYAVRTLHCLVVEDPACPDTILYMFCNITTHCISTECQQTFAFKPCHLPNLRMIRECACL